LNTHLSGGEGSNDDGGHLDVILLLLLVLLGLLSRDVSVSPIESLRRDDLVGELEDGSSRSVGEILSKGSVGEGEVSGDRDDGLNSL